MNTFKDAIQNITTCVAFNKEWNNGTGYMNGAVHADLGLRPGDKAKSVDDTGRNIVLIGTRFGNVVVFERYTDQDVYVSNVPYAVEALCGGTSVGSALTDEMIRFLIGNHYGMRNVGRRIEELLTETEVL